MLWSARPSRLHIELMVSGADVKIKSKIFGPRVGSLTIWEKLKSKERLMNSREVWQDDDSVVQSMLGKLKSPRR